MERKDGFKGDCGGTRCTNWLEMKGNKIRVDKSYQEQTIKDGSGWFILGKVYI